MQVNFARPGTGLGSLSLMSVLLLAACTTTTTVTTSDDSFRAAQASTRERPARPAASSRDYLVKPGDTLYAIAFRNRVDLRELIAWNGLSDPYTIYPGQRLRIADVVTPTPPSSRGSEPSPAARADRSMDPGRGSGRRADDASNRVAQGVATARPERSSGAAPDATGTGSAHAASPAGRTPAGEATHSRDASSGAPPVSSLPAIPIAVDEGVRAAVVEEPEATREPDAGAAEGAPAGVAMRTATPPPPPPPQLPRTPAEPQRDAGPIRAMPTRIAGGIGWRWPSSATLVGRFAADDEARQGIRMQGPAGMPVHATADGEVVYSGNGLVGLGELVIIKHGSEYLSAYGLNRKRLVTEGQKVLAGQPVAEMGNSAGVAGLLHFEVRRNGRPIDPLTVLPPR